MREKEGVRERESETERKKRPLLLSTGVLAVRLK